MLALSKTDRIRSDGEKVQTSSLANSRGVYYVVHYQHGNVLSAELLEEQSASEERRSFSLVSHPLKNQCISPRSLLEDLKCFVLKTSYLKHSVKD